MQITCNGNDSRSKSADQQLQQLQQLHHQQQQQLNGMQLQKCPTPSSLGANGGGMDMGDSKTNLIVNYLPQTMSQDDIRSLFSTIGEIETCKLIRDKSTGQSLGYGFVNYKNQDQARKAIDSLNGLRLQNKTIKAVTNQNTSICIHELRNKCKQTGHSQNEIFCVSYARPSCESIKDANVYICGLPRTLTQQELERIFSSCGKIISARIIYDNQTGLSKGVGFVRYDQRIEAERAIKQLNGVVPEGSGSHEPITVKFANSPSSNRNHMMPLGGNNMAAYLSPSRRMLGNMHHAANRLRFPSLDGSFPANLLGSSGSGGGLGSGSGAWCLFVYNLAPETEENVLWQLFGPFGAVQSVKVMRDFQTQKCKGFGFVTMTNYEDCLVAVAALNGYQLGNRMLQVSFKKSKNSYNGNTDSALAAAMANL